MLILRPFQKEALQALNRPNHIVCVAPTGSGKSLIYERRAVKKGTRTLLVTPLVALARQQYQRLTDLGLQVCMSAGGMIGAPTSETDAWIASPESLLFPFRQSLLKKWKPNFLVVDECHCLWDWGDDFRPAFAQIPELIETLGISRSLWLTATLPKKARQTLLSKLPSSVKEIGDFDLPTELHLDVLQVPWPKRTEAILRWIRKQKGSGILFVNTRESTMKLTLLISAFGKKAAAYHAGLSQEERKAVERMIRESELDVVVATSAFGMGMDYPQLKWVALWQSPLSLLALAQAIGRVGRASAQGTALVLWDHDDFKLLEWSIRNSERRREELADILKFLTQYGCRKMGLKTYFNDRHILTPCLSSCDFCLSSERPIVIV